jgi:hypothetical protein
MISPRGLLVLGAVVLVILAVAVVFIGRALKSQVASRSRSAARRGGTDRQWAVTPMPTGMARTLTERGLVNAQQLASMSPAERDFFVATVAARVGEGAKPKLMGGQSNGNGNAAPNGAERATRAPGATDVGAAGETQSRAAAGSAPGEGSDPAAGGDAMTAALVSGGIHCPVCRGPLGQRSETPLLMSRCPGCGRRVGVRVEGNRLTVTVQYGAPTPAAGTPAVGGGPGR